MPVQGAPGVDRWLRLRAWGIGLAAVVVACTAFFLLQLRLSESSDWWYTNSEWAAGGLIVVHLLLTVVAMVLMRPHPSDPPAYGWILRALVIHSGILAVWLSGFLLGMGLNAVVGANDMLKAVHRAWFEVGILAPVASVVFLGPVASIFAACFCRRGYWFLIAQVVLGLAVVVAITGPFD